jgi:uncharacterized protein (UPF0276 family)
MADNRNNTMHGFGVLPEQVSKPRPFAIPPRAGVGFKISHAEAILENKPDIGWFEVHPENYMGDGGPPHRILTMLREDYPLSLHGVGLSVGGNKPLDKDHLARLKALNDRYQPGLFSEHLAWSTHDDVFYNDLLPLPYTDETLQMVVDHVCQTQDFLNRQILIENPSTYVVFETSTMSEIEFLSELSRRSGCGLLLDVNNVFVSATNHKTSPEAYLDAFPLHRIGEIHLAGHATDEDDEGAPLLIDAHDREVADSVWSLYESVIARIGAVPTLIEWDNDVPAWPVLYQEAMQADRILEAAGDPIPLMGARHG